MLRSCGAEIRTRYGNAIRERLRRGSESLHRQRRAATTPPPPLTSLPENLPLVDICNNWSPWISVSTPAQYGGRNESDVVTAAQVKKYCPSNNISQIKCADVAKGEPFSARMNISSGDNKYMFSCGQFSDGSWGVECHITDVNGTCPDFKYHFNCSCDPNAGTYM